MKRVKFALSESTTGYDRFAVIFKNVWLFQEESNVGNIPKKSLRSRIYVQCSLYPAERCRWIAIASWTKILPCPFPNCDVVVVEGWNCPAGARVESWGQGCRALCRAVGTSPTSSICGWDGLWPWPSLGDTSQLGQHCCVVPLIRHRWCMLPPIVCGHVWCLCTYLAIRLVPPSEYPMEHAFLARTWPGLMCRVYHWRASIAPHSVWVRPIVWSCWTAAFYC